VLHPPLILIDNSFVLLAERSTHDTHDTHTPPHAHNAGVSGEIHETVVS
jgi:hypothetical protein